MAAFMTQRRYELTDGEWSIIEPADAEEAAGRFPGLMIDGC